MFGEKFEGEKIKLSKISNPIIGLTYRPDNVCDDGTIVLRSGNIQNNELQIVDDVIRVTGVKINDNKYIQDKDILMCSRNGSARLVGKSCLIRNPQEKMTFGAFMTVIRTNYPYFLQSFFTSQYFKEQLTGVATTSVNQITSTMLNNYEVIEPSIEEEIEFASFVELIDKSKFINYSRYFLWEFLTLFSSTIAYSSVVSILA
jgi:type I restriction enzyme S subunit